LYDIKCQIDDICCSNVRVNTCVRVSETAVASVTVDIYVPPTNPARSIPAVLSKLCKRLVRTNGEANNKIPARTSISFASNGHMKVNLFAITGEIVTKRIRMPS
jgi:effector-binding domain-containing protein